MNYLFGARVGKEWVSYLVVLSLLLPSISISAKAQDPAQAKTETTPPAVVTADQGQAKGAEAKGAVEPETPKETAAPESPPTPPKAKKSRVSRILTAGTPEAVAQDVENGDGSRSHLFLQATQAMRKTEAWSLAAMGAIGAGILLYPVRDKVDLAVSAYDVQLGAIERYRNQIQGSQDGVFKRYREAMAKYQEDRAILGETLRRGDDNSYAINRIRANEGRIVPNPAQVRAHISAVEAGNNYLDSYNAFREVTIELEGTVELPGPARQALGRSIRSLPAENVVTEAIENAVDNLNKVVKEGAAHQAVTQWVNQFDAAEEFAKRATGTDNAGRLRRFARFCLKRKFKTALFLGTLGLAYYTYNYFNHEIELLEDGARKSKTDGMDSGVAQMMALDSNWMEFADTEETMWLDATEDPALPEFKYPSLFELVLKYPEQSSNLMQKILKESTEAEKDEQKQLEESKPQPDASDPQAAQEKTEEAKPEPVPLTDEEKEKLEDPIIERITKKKAESEYLYFEKFRPLIRMLWIKAKVRYFSAKKQQGIWNPNDPQFLSIGFAHVLWEEVFAAIDELSANDPDAAFNKLPTASTVKQVLNPSHRTKYKTEKTFGKADYIGLFAAKTRGVPLEEWSRKKVAKEMRDEEKLKEQEKLKKAEEAAANPPAVPAAAVPVAKPPE